MFSQGSFPYLSDIYESEEIGSALADSVASLGLVGLAHFWGALSILAKATAKYNSALKAISTHLTTVDGAKSDQTIIAIVLLGLYETNTCNSRISMETWERHITGASALLQLRGKEQLRTLIGYHLFIHLRTQVITNCIQRHAQVPDIISDWSQDLYFETVEQATATTLSNLAIRYCNLRASMSSFRDYSDSERIIATACALDFEYEMWTKTCPLQYIYQTVNLNERSEDVFSDHYHVYSSVWLGALWNNYRSARILVNELILDQLGYFVPYFLGYKSGITGFMDQAPKSVNGNLLLWPLYTAGVTGIVSDMMRVWVAGRLEWIADVMGIRQAGPLAYSMLRRQDHLLWNPDLIENASLADVCELAYNY
ncbi:related to negative acting factor [Rhynchosporium secalis]|uniref:Related to negative acting factor n=1 Tax=Rhynchosporium secalis TaxID=38038 RepID=A0A1E1M5Z9_RHYSE|nr:related to negative acting factor [Rhynchosporium secalis]